MALRRALVLVAGALKELTGDFLKVPGVVFDIEYDNGNAGAAKTIDFANGLKQKVTLNANTTLTISALPGVTSGQLRIIQDATGGRTLAFSGLSASRWAGSASAPSINAAANGESLLTVFFDGAANIQSLIPVGVGYTPPDSAPAAAAFVTLATDATLTSERVLTAGTGISMVDAGAGGNLTINAALTPGRAVARALGLYMN